MAPGAVHAVDRVPEVDAAGLVAEVVAGAVEIPEVAAVDAHVEWSAAGPAGRRVWGFDGKRFQSAR